MIRAQAVVSCAVLLAASTGGAKVLKPLPADLAAKYDPFTRIAGPTRRIVYSSYRGTLHLLEAQRVPASSAPDSQRARPAPTVLVEKLTRDLWSPVLTMLAADLDGDGQEEVVGYTQDSRLFVLNGTNLQDIWNTQLGRFKSIKALTVADLDRDGKREILMVADGLLRIFSGMQDIEQWKSSDPYNDTEIAVGDVDGDGKDEIVLNSGIVLGAVFRDVKWNYSPGFGRQMDLYDIDGDGKLEIIGIGSDGLLRVFDVDERRQKWN